MEGRGDRRRRAHGPQRLIEAIERRRPDPVAALEAEGSPALRTQAGRVRITSDVAAAVAGARSSSISPAPTAR